ncbi:hypothetical protein BDV10DRAFT_26806 [Aspergillus recurvatus]
MIWKYRPCRACRVTDMPEISITASQHRQRLDVNSERLVSSCIKANRIRYKTASHFPLVRCLAERSAHLPTKCASSTTVTFRPSLCAGNVRRTYGTTHSLLHLGLLKRHTTRTGPETVTGTGPCSLSIGRWKGRDVPHSPLFTDREPSARP